MKIDVSKLEIIAHVLIAENDFVNLPISLIGVSGGKTFLFKGVHPSIR